MATNLNNVHTSSFNKGMNSDTSYDMVGDGQYIFGLNIRITLNSLLRAVTDSNSTEGIVTPVNAGEEVSTEGMYTDNKIQILATASIEDVGAVIVSSGNKWKLYRIDFDKNPIKFSLLFESEEYEKPFNHKFSVVINKEINDVVKLYIADGVHQLMQVNLLDDEYNSKISGNTDNITSNRLYPSLLTKILKQISGLLKTSQILYTYRFYKKYGIYSKLAPLTSKILIIDSNRNKEDGNAEDTKTSMGLLIGIQLQLDANKGLFDHIQVFRLQYVKAQDDAQVSLIYDAKLEDVDQIKIDDDGSDPLSEYSIDEFSSMSSMSLIPLNLELNLNYMFVSNIKDDTILRIDKSKMDIDSKTYRRRIWVDESDNDGWRFVLRNNTDVTNGNDLIAPNSIEGVKPKYDVNPNSIITRDVEELQDWENCRFRKHSDTYYFGGEGKNINWNFVTTAIPLHDNYSRFFPSAPTTSLRFVNSDICYIKYDGTKVPTGLKISDYFSQHLISAYNKSGYDDPMYSSMLRSLKRDEVYRYGVVYYDKYGKRSDVLWIGDLRTPDYKESDPFHSEKTESNFVQLLCSGRSYFVYGIDEHGTFGGRAELYCKFGTSQHYIYTTQSSGYLELESTTGYIQGPSGASVPFNNFVQVCNLYGDSLIYKIYYKVDDNYYSPGGGHIYVPKGKHIYLYLERITTLEYESSERSNDDRGIRPVSEKTAYIRDYSDYNSDGNGHVSPGKDYKYIDKIKSFALTIGLREDYPEDDGGFGYNDYGMTAYFYVESSAKFRPLENVANTLFADTLGIKFDVTVPKSTGITSCLIVRCAKTRQYSKHVMQCALSRPIKQNYGTVNQTGIHESPLYPMPFLYSGFFATPDYLHTDNANNFNNYRVFLMLSPEISAFPEDSKLIVQQTDSKLHTISYAYDGLVDDIQYQLNGYQSWSEAPIVSDGSIIYYKRHASYGAASPESLEFKTDKCCTMCYYNRAYLMKNTLGGILYNKYATILSTSDVKNPTWEQGFTNIQLDGSKIISGVKAYKSYVSSVMEDSYVNWVSNGMYNLRITDIESQSGLHVPTEDDDDDDESPDVAVKVFTYQKTDSKYTAARDIRARGWIGPGPQCLLVRIAKSEGSVFDNSVTCDELGLQTTIGSVICNIEHVAQLFAGFSDQEKQFDVYYGFGNFCSLEDDGNGNMKGSLMVFDGDTYLTPCELVSMYKTYNFNSVKDSIPSAQVVNFVPMETKINTYFDYGMNYQNTSSNNLQTEPGEITGVATQERPLHQYNPIYSDNNVSNDVYNAQSEEDLEQTFTLRIHYSLLKINGEPLDNWSDFRALNYIDADTRYGEITHMLTRKDVLYFWQSSAFGKLSVNERSLVTDNNNNTIQLGQGGVLLRTDYIDTKHGIRKDDRSAISTNDGLFWIDVYNKAVLGNANDLVVNYGERLNVQNTLNEHMTDNLPYIEYDGLNLELLCKCLKGGNQIVFNTKLNCSTGIYTRDYVDTILHRNTVYGISNKLVKYNNLIDDDNAVYLSPVILKFSVNQNYSTTKVFDTQQIITMKRDYDENFAKDFMKDKLIEFETNLGKSEYRYNQNEVVTDRESNLTYSIPRQNNSDYGNRLRGRWMTVSITDNNPKYDFAISHVLTKYRQSFV